MNKWNARTYTKIRKKHVSYNSVCNVKVNKEKMGCPTSKYMYVRYPQFMEKSVQVNWYLYGTSHGKMMTMNAMLNKKTYTIESVVNVTLCEFYKVSQPHKVSQDSWEIYTTLTEVLLYLY